MKNNCGGVNLFMFQVFSSNLTKNKYPQRFFSRSSFMFLGRASLRNTTIVCFRNIKDQIIEFTTKF